MNLYSRIRYFIYKAFDFIISIKLMKKLNIIYYQFILFLKFKEIKMIGIKLI